MRLRTACGLTVLLAMLAAAFFTLARPGNTETTPGTVIFGLASLICVVAAFAPMFAWSHARKPQRYHLPRHTPQYVTVWRQAHDQAMAEVQARVIDLEPVAVRPELPAA